MANLSLMDLYFKQSEPYSFTTKLYFQVQSYLLLMLGLIGTTPIRLFIIPTPNTNPTISHTDPGIPNTGRVISEIGRKCGRIRTT
ncbi:hypothetical protein M8J75_002630 [Diaphorina citri]|nr:hypothetical protein M8J75_002630 [Diaphorina citri]